MKLFKLKPGLRSQLVTICVLLVIVPIAIIAILTYIDFKKHAYRDIDKELGGLANDWRITILVSSQVFVFQQKPSSPPLYLPSLPREQSLQPKGT